MRTTPVKPLLAALAAAATLSACFSPMSFVDRAVDRAAGRAADRAGESVGNRIADHYAPQMQQMYMSMMFSMAFASGGYAVGLGDYKPGDFTRWVIPNKDDKDAKESVLERAYLFDDKDGNQWWKVKWVLDPKKPEESTFIVEALFDKKNLTLLRERAKMPNEKEGKEIPVTENTYYTPPQRLTKQSLEGATVSTGPVTVPAGTFTARKVVYGTGGGSSEWYLADRVPGAMVKMVSRPRDDSRAYEMDLQAFGGGAASELGIKP